MFESPVPSRSRPFWIAVLLLGVASALRLGVSVPRTPYFGDEAGWVHYGMRASDLLLEGEFGPAALEQERSSYGNLNPQLGKLLVGLPLVAYTDGLLDGERFERVPYQWDRSFEWNERNGAAPVRQLRLAARSVTALYGVLLIGVVLAFASTACSPAVGLLAAALVLASDLFVRCATRAMTDVPYAIFLLLGAWVIADMLRRPDRRPPTRWAALVGVFGGLASSVKVTGFLVVGATFALVALTRTAIERRGGAMTLRGGAVVAATSIAVVLLLNPFYWPELGRVDLPETASELARIADGEGTVELGTSWGEYLGAIMHERSAVREAFPQLSNLLRPLEFPISFLRWRNLIALAAGKRLWQGGRLPTIASDLLRRHSEFPLQFLLTAWGLVVCLLRVRGDAREGRTSPYLVPAAWFLVNLTFVLVAVRAIGDRYYLSTVIAERILVAVALCDLYERARRWIQRRPEWGAQFPRSPPG